MCAHVAGDGAVGGAHEQHVHQLGKVQVLPAAIDDGRRHDHGQRPVAGVVVVGVEGGDGIGSRPGKIRLVGGDDGRQGLLPGVVEGGEAGGADGGPPGSDTSWRCDFLEGGLPEGAGVSGGGNVGERCGQDEEGDDG